MMVMDLLPGQRVRLGGMSAVFIARNIHPLWPALQLVVWKLDDGTWSHDALSGEQDVGEADPSTWLSRQENLKAVFMGVGKR